MAFKLSADNKAMLSTIAAKMKSVPTDAVIIQVYVGGERHQAIYYYRGENIKKYLVEREGILDTRITLNFETTGDSQTVDILPQQ